MSSYPHESLDIQSVADEVPSHLPTETLRRRLGELIDRYASERSSRLAETVVHHIEALYLRSDVLFDPDHQAACRRLACHWRRLASQAGAEQLGCAGPAAQNKLGADSADPIGAAQIH